MDEINWIAALGLVLVIEGIGPMLVPNGWREVVTQMASQPDNLLRRLGGILVTVGLVILYIF